MIDIDIENQPKKCITTDGKPYASNVGTETFFHELKHIVDAAYAGLQRNEEDYDYSPLEEYDAISFAGEACFSLQKSPKYKGEKTQQRNTFSYEFEHLILDENIKPEQYPATTKEASTIMGHRILAERGLDSEADALLKNTPEENLGYKIEGEKTTFRERAISEKHNTKIDGKSVKWVETIQSKHSLGERKL